MARYKAIDTSPRFLAVDLEKQLLPGSFEHAVHHLLDHEFNLPRFDTRYRNDQSGACAYDTVSEVRQALARYFDFYNRRRPHSTLDGKTPDTAYFNQPLLSAAA